MPAAALPGLGTLEDTSSNAGSTSSPGSSDVTGTVSPATSASTTDNSATGVEDQNYTAALDQLSNLQMSQPPPSSSSSTAFPSTGTSGGLSPQWNQLQSAYQSWLGVPYVYGGSSKSGVDCSGLTSSLYASLGMNIGRDTTAQMKSPLGHAVGQDGNWASAQGQLQPGDLIFYGAPGASGPNAHVVMYIGNGQVLQAPHTGSNVQISPLFSAASSSEPFAGVRRYLSQGVAANTPYANSGGNIGSWIQQAEQATGVSPATWAAGLALIAKYESGYNPNAINRTDSNAQAGHPSQGLMQTIPSTFDQYVPASLKSRGILDPVANIAAAIEYIIARYGNINNVPGVRAVNSGGKYVGY